MDILDYIEKKRKPDSIFQPELNFKYYQREIEREKNKFILA